MHECTLITFGGWNPRWPEDHIGTKGLRMLSMETLAWSLLPSDDDLSVRPNLSCVVQRAADRFPHQVHTH